MKFKKNKNNIFLENEGQAGAVFRLMIDAIVGIAILAIIIGLIANFNQQQYIASIEEFNTKVIAASQSPDGSVITTDKDLLFSKGTAFSIGDMQELTGYPANCFAFISNRAFIDVRGNSNVIVSGGGSAVEMLQNTNTKVYVKCNPTGDAVTDSDDTQTCEIECVISFGEKLESDFLRSED